MMDTSSYWAVLAPLAYIRSSASVRAWITSASYGTDNANVRGAAAPDFSERDTMGDDKMHLANGAAAPNLSERRHHG